MINNKKEFIDSYTCNWDDFLEEELGLQFDNHNITELMYKFIGGGKIQVKAYKNTIIIKSLKR